MKTKLILTFLVTTAAVTFAVFLPSNDAPSTTATQASLPTPVENRVDKISMQGAADSVETEMVMGIAVRKDRNCIVQRHYVDLGNGTVTDAYSCVPLSADYDDYDHYSDEQLTVLSYGDARAASVLGKRLVETDPARSEALLLRAVALEPGNLDPVMWLSAQAHSLRGDSKTADKARANTYVLTRTAQALGSDATIEWILADLEAAGFDAADVLQLEQRVREKLQQIRAVQLEVFGESTISEVSL